MHRVTLQSLRKFRTEFAKAYYSNSSGSTLRPPWKEKCSPMISISTRTNQHQYHMTKGLCYNNQCRPINTFFNFAKLLQSGKSARNFSTNLFRARNFQIQSLNSLIIVKLRVKENQTRNFSTSTSKQSTIKGSKMGGKGPGLIVFDLDCTLWPLHVDTTVNPPFVQKDSKIVDQDGKLITYYPEVPQVLEYLKSEGYPIGVASRTTKPPAAEQLLNFFDWNKYISYKEIYPGSKVTHFARFVEQTKLPHEEMLFFDDEQRNIIDMKQQGVKCIFVENGVNLQLVKDSIQQFKDGKL